MAISSSEILYFFKYPNDGIMSIGNQMLFSTENQHDRLLPEDYYISILYDIDTTKEILKYRKLCIEINSDYIHGYIKILNEIAYKQFKLYPIVMYNYLRLQPQLQAVQSKELMDEIRFITKKLRMMGISCWLTIPITYQKILEELYSQILYH